MRAHYAAARSVECAKKTPCHRHQLMLSLTWLFQRGSKAELDAVSSSTNVGPSADACSITPVGVKPLAHTQLKSQQQTKSAANPCKLAHTSRINHSPPPTPI